MIFQHHRFQVWNANQHPYKHSLSDFPYSNPAMPGVSTTQGALDYILAVLYPQSQAAVATPAALPLVGNTINDMRVVSDDGDGKAAAYRWEQREGEASASWHKIYDLDWGTDSILTGFLLKTQDIYLKQWGYDDLDATGAVITGTLGGQSLYGGATAGKNLTFFANSGDGVGADTGYVQFGDQVRPITNNVYDLGTSSEKFRIGYFGTGLFAGTMSISSSLISDTSGEISFDNENLTTTGTINSGDHVATSFIAGSLVISDGSITDGDGTINFGSTSLATTGIMSAADRLITGTLTLDSGSITDTSGTISFDNEDLTTSGSVAGGSATFTTTVTAGASNIRLSANALSIIGTGDLNLVAAVGESVLITGNTLETVGQIVTGTVTITGQLNADNLRLDANTLSSTNVNGNITIDPSGTGLIEFGSGFYPALDSAEDIGKTGSVWNKLWIDGSIGGASEEITITDLMTLRNAPFRDSARTQPAQAGDALFYNGTMWLASAPDTEITHSTVSGLTTGDAGHTQFVMLAGRSGGQSIQGGTAASETLNLESTAHATKGVIQAKDTFRAFTDASYSGGWNGADLGGSSNRFRHLYTAGEHFGLRLENVGALPSPSTQNIGRLVYLTTDGSPYVDTGTAFERIGYRKFQSDTSWNGSDTTKTVTTSPDIDDARTAIWQLCDNTNDFDRIYCSIKAISATQITITVGTALPAGSYRLIGIE